MWNRSMIKILYIEFGDFKYQFFVIKIIDLLFNSINESDGFPSILHLLAYV